MLDKGAANAKMIKESAKFFEPPPPSEIAMSMPLLSTKLSAKPPRADFVPRPHLVERLNQGATQKLTLICAPAGFGKSTLVSIWAQQAANPVTWLTLIDGFANDE